MATIVAGILSGAVDLLPVLSTVINPAVYPLMLFSLGLLNIALRLITDTGIEK
jgi:hypothetical protein